MARRATVDPDREHDQRLERAKYDLEQWGRWLVQRTSGGLGYGRSVLANLERVDRTSDHYQAPINETHCSWVDDAVNSLPQDTRIHARLHFGGQFSYRFIAREHKVAPATVSRNIDLAIRTVAYWQVGAAAAATVMQCVQSRAESGNLGSRAPGGQVRRPPDQASPGPERASASPPPRRIARPS